MKILWDGTRDLSGEDAGKADVLLSAKSGAMTTGELRDAVRRAVIRIDPAAAGRRRKRAEKNSRVKLYANENHTATLSLEDVPAAQGAAARARINAIARAAKSAGAGGELALPEAMTAIGLLLGTLPLIGPPVPPGDSPRDPGDAGPDGGPGEDTCTGEDPATVTGKFYAVRDVYNSPRPVHGPIPVLVAGGGEKRTLDLAARYGDACNVFAGEPAQVRHKFDVLARHCERVGRNPAEITKTVFAFDTSDLGALAASAQALAAAGADGMIIVGPEDPSKIPAIGRVLADVFP